MKLKIITPEELEKISNKELISLHYRTHQLYSLSLKKDSILLLSLLKCTHNIISEEMKKRGLTHLSLIERYLIKLQEENI